MRINALKIKLSKWRILKGQQEDLLRKNNTFYTICTVRFIGPAKSADKSNRVKRPLRSTAAASTKTFFKITSFHFPNFFVISPVCRTSINYPNYSGSEVGGTVLKPGENVIKFRRSRCPQSLRFLVHVAVVES